MISLLWLILAGLAWLFLVQISSFFSFPPQLVSLARSGYIGIFSVFMMLELRREISGRIDSSNVIGLRFDEAGWYFLPLFSLVLLASLSHELILTPMAIITIVGFYVCQLYILFLREKLMGMRSAVWDLAPPLFFALMLLSPFIVFALTLFGFVGIALLLLQGRKSSSTSSDIADTLIMQIPSLCLAPVILIAIRDYIDIGGVFGRAQLETIGMIVNGVGAAIWTAVVMRSSKHLAQLATILWCAAVVLVAMGLFISNALVVSILAVVSIELLRGTLWLGATHLLRFSSRWKGFAKNLAATALPFLALLVAHSNFNSRYFILVYATFHLAIPLVLLVEIYLQRSSTNKLLEP